MNEKCFLAYAIATPRVYHFMKREHLGVHLVVFVGDADLGFVAYVPLSAHIVFSRLSYVHLTAVLTFYTVN